MKKHFLRISYFYCYIDPFKKVLGHKRVRTDRSELSELC